MMSSSDEEFFLLDSVLPRLKFKRKRSGIRKINRERDTCGEYHQLFQELKDHPDRFHSYTGMSFDTFKYILDKIESRLIKRWCNFHRPILPEEQLVVTLRYLTAGLSLNNLALAFRMGATTVSGIVTKTTKVLWDELHHHHMPVPTTDTFLTVAKEFEEIWNFPHCVGVISGKQVHTKCLASFGSTALQAAVDAKYKFITIDIGNYGTHTDKWAFQASNLYQSLITKSLRIPKPSPLPQSDLVAPYVFISDESYPLLPFLMKPYRGTTTNLPSEKDDFNRRLSSCRKMADRAFNTINSKWAVLSKCIETGPDLVKNIIQCICVLHNTIIDREQEDYNIRDGSPSLTDIEWALMGRPTNDAKGVRDVFTAFFADNPRYEKNQK